MSVVYIGGVEGGATHSKFVICDGSGAVVARASGPGTNHWQVGIKECAKRIADMVAKGKSEANIPQTLKLKSIGLSLSGCEQEATNKELENELRKSYPNLSEHYFVCSDTVGSIATISSLGGVVLISGTGSNAMLRNPDGSTFNCGGWGHQLGDEGSAWWISHQGMKIVFDHMDNFEKSAYPIDRTWELIKEHFSVETRLDLLDHCYAKFNKSTFAGLCQKMATAANSGDSLCQQIFTRAGSLLARSVIALLPNVKPDLVKTGDLSVVCVGSVWKSWDLMTSGFLKEINKVEIPYNISLKKLTVDMAVGAVYLAADDNKKYDIKRDYSKNCEVFHCFSKNKAVNGNGVS